VGQLVDVELISWDRWQYSKLNCPTLLWGELTKQLQLKGSFHQTTALTTLYDLAPYIYLTSILKPILWTEEENITHKPVTW
jgi:hypothetical protein